MITTPSQGSVNRRKTAHSRAVAAVVDQALSSLGNYVVLFGSLRVLRVDELGAFTLSYTATLLVLVLFRALLLEPLAVRFTTAPSEAQQAASGAAAGASLICGLGLLAAFTTVQLLWHAAALGVVGSLGLILPVLLVQDAWRSSLFSRGRPWGAAFNDGVCAIAILAALVASLQFWAPSVEMLLLAWGMGTLPGALFGAWQLGSRPRLLAAMAWFRQHRDLGISFAGEVLGERLSGQLAVLLVGVVGGLQVLGELSAAIVVLAPMTTLITSATNFALPEAARRRDTGARSIQRFAATLSGLVAGVTLAFTALMLLAPGRLGTFIAGENWSSVRDLLMPMGLATAASGARQGPRAILRSHERGGTIVRLSLFGSSLLLISAVAGTALAGGAGAAWAFAFSFCCITAAWWAAARHSIVHWQRVSAPK